MWPRFINTFLGLWLMVAPAILGFDKTIATNDQIVGPVVATFAIIAIWEATRVVRLYNLPLGLWLLLAPWVLGYDNTTAIINDMVVGGLIILFASIKGNITQRFGGGWSAIWKSNSLHVQEAEKRAAQH